MQKGAISIYIIIILLLTTVFAVTLIGGLKYKKRPPLSTSQTKITCCDSGNGESCRGITSSSFSYNSSTYDLLKSNVFLTEMGKHGKIVDEQKKLFIIEHGDEVPGNCSSEPFDINMDHIEGGIYREGGKTKACIQVPKGLLVYVCREDMISCRKALTEKDEGTVPFDVYIKRGEEIPPSIKFCDAAKPTPVPGTSEQTLNYPTKGVKAAIQVDTFTVSGGGAAHLAMWLSPWCKPAVYLYPREKTAVHVKIQPKGKLTLTIPQYPKEGWRVTAHPSGKIDSGFESYDYLYYEAQMPDEILEIPNEGYVIDYKNLQTFLPELLSKLHLNEKEARDFIYYWVKVLPKSPYYAIKILDQSHLDTISPLFIMPRPDSILRVSLYFEALDEKKTLVEPALNSFDRNGFTVVEWGGIFKRDNKHSFSCFM